MHHSRAERFIKEFEAHFITRSAFRPGDRFEVVSVGLTETAMEGVVKPSILFKRLADTEETVRLHEDVIAFDPEYWTDGEIFHYLANAPNVLRPGLG